MSGFSKKDKLEEDEFYLTPEGYRVFTEKYLLKRGKCCKNGCKHCPYGFKVEQLIT
jgi:L-lysine 2,3-aminomutase